MLIEKITGEPATWRMRAFVFAITAATLGAVWLMAYSDAAEEANRLAECSPEFSCYPPQYLSSDLAAGVTLLVLLALSVEVIAFLAQACRRVYRRWAT